jgi:hypothetical protein
MLRVETRVIVRTLLEISRNASEIMNTLELHFGNKKILAKNIIQDWQDFLANGLGQI